MKSVSSLFLALLAVSCAASGWFLWSQYRDLISLRAAVVAPEVSVNLRKEVAKIQKELATVKARLAVTVNPDGASAADKDAVASAKEAKKEKKDATKFDFATMMKNPEIRRLMQLQQRGWFDQQFAGLFKQMSATLTPDQLVQFKNLSFERMASQQDAYAMAIDQGIDPKTDPQGFSQVMRTVSEDMESKIKAVIGDANYAQAQQYTSQLQQRNTATALQASLSYTQTPLTDDQVSQLTQLLAQNPAPRDPNAVATVVQPGGGRVTMRGGSSATTTATGQVQSISTVSDSVVTAAASVLTQPQLDALKQLQQVQQSEFQLGQLLTPPKKAAAPGTK